MTVCVLQTMARKQRHREPLSELAVRVFTQEGPEEEGGLKPLVRPIPGEGLPLTWTYYLS